MVVVIKAIHGNPYDGNTLKETVEKAQETTEIKVEAVFAGRGYKGKENSSPGVKVFLSGSKRVIRNF